MAINEENEIVGHIGLDASSIDKNGSVELRRCSVAAKCQKLGIGRLLVDHFLDKAKNCFEFTQKNEQLMDDVIYLCRSLGFSCYKSNKNTSWTHNGIKKTGT